MSEIKANYGKYVSGFQPSDLRLSPVNFWAFTISEADRLLQTSFAQELAVVFDSVPKERQTCLFTATLTPAIENLAAAPPKHGKQKPFVHRMTAA